MDDRLETLRKRITDLDEQLIKAAARRMAVSREIGRFKREQDLKIIDPAVEKQILDQGRKLAEAYELDGGIAGQLLATLIRESRKEQLLIRRRQQQGRCLIVGGRGMMGRWFTDYFQSNGFEVSVFDKATAAKKLSLAEAARGQDFILLSTPISETAAVLKKLTELRPKAAVIEIASIKQPLLKALNMAAAAGLKIYSLHPMFGPAASVADDLTILHCEAAFLQRGALVRKLFREANFKLRKLPLNDHDRFMAFVLGAPHLLSLSFAKTLTEAGTWQNLLTQAGPSLRRQMQAATAIAHDNPGLCYEIQNLNPYSNDLVAVFEKHWRGFAKLGREKDSKNFVRAMTQLKKVIPGPRHS